MNNLQHYRKRAGLSQAQLAEKVDISHRTLQDYEQNRKPLEKAAAITVLRMARILGCSVEDLIEEDEETYQTTCPACGTAVICLTKVKSFLDCCPICGEKLKTK